ncbi:MAG TPA: methyl-accepting chemotaxis protein, partial [Pyrinomonadaceae bacterium]|nr:methyl-accepting chemotaxis protein [Pyrinomonadaceae bacterium]
LTGMLFASLLLISLISFLTIRNLDSAQLNLGSTQLPAIRNISIADMYHDAISGSVYKALIAGESKDEVRKNEVREEFEEHITNIKKNFAELNKLDLNQDAKGVIREVEPMIDQYIKTTKELIDLALSGQREKAENLMPQFQKDFSALEVNLDKLGDIIEKNAGESVENSNQIVAWSTYKLIFFLLASLMISLLATFLVARALLNPMYEITEIASKLAVGEIDQTILYESKDEIGVLAESFRKSISHTRDMVRAAEFISRGDLEFFTLKPKSDKDVLTNNFIKVCESLKNLNRETQLLIHSAEEGDLSKRGDVSHFEGTYAELINGINHVMDAIADPINEASDCLKKVSQRDLTAQMKGNYKGEFSRIKDSLNTALANLNEGMRQINEGAEQVSESAGQISAGSQFLAQSSSEQASTLEEVSSSLQEISAMTRQNSRNSLEARSLSESARKIAETGMHKMELLNEAVDRIQNSSESTQKIIKTIEEIAFQTNLLALNAAVEAARAGDAGKGFAVVAEEVRNLAMRSAEAAKNTAQLIDDSVKNTLDGAVIHKEVAVNLHEIFEEINKVTVVSAEIAAATEQQSEGIEQINIAIEQMNQVTQQTAANSEQSASSAEELSGQSQEMLGLISSYQLFSNSAGINKPLRGKSIQANYLTLN